MSRSRGELCGSSSSALIKAKLALSLPILMQLQLHLPLFFFSSPLFSIRSHPPSSAVTSPRTTSSSSRALGTRRLPCTRSSTEGNQQPRWNPVWARGKWGPPSFPAKEYAYRDFAWTEEDAGDPLTLELSTLLFVKGTKSLISETPAAAAAVHFSPPFYFSGRSFFSPWSLLCSYLNSLGQFLVVFFFKL